MNQYRCNYRKNPRCNPPSIASGGNNSSGGSGSNGDGEGYEENRIWDVNYWENGITANNPTTFMYIVLTNDPVYGAPMLMHYPEYPGESCLSLVCF